MEGVGVWRVVEWNKNGTLNACSLDFLVGARSGSGLLDFFILERRERTKQFGTIRQYYSSAKQLVEGYGKSDQYEIAVLVPLSTPHHEVPNDRELDCSGTSPSPHREGRPVP